VQGAAFLRRCVCPGSTQPERATAGHQSACGHSKTQRHSKACSRETGLRTWRRSHVHTHSRAHTRTGAPGLLLHHPRAEHRLLVTGAAAASTSGGGLGAASSGGRGVDGRLLLGADGRPISATRVL